MHNELWALCNVRFKGGNAVRLVLLSGEGTALTKQWVFCLILCQARVVIDTGPTSVSFINQCGRFGQWDKEIFILPQSNALLLDTDL